jgi:hypothetical protein
MRDATDDDAFSSLVYMYGKQVPATVPPCPSWCTNPYCARGLDYFDYTVDGLAVRTTWPTRAKLGFRCQWRSDTSRTAPTSSLRRRSPTASASHRAESLGVTAETARRMAAELLEAAAVVETITTPDMRVSEAPAPEQPSSRSMFVEAAWADVTLSTDSKVILLNAYDEKIRESEREQDNP